MSPTRTLARPLLASMFIAGGLDALRNPGPRQELVAKAGERVELTPPRKPAAPWTLSIVRG